MDYLRIYKNVPLDPNYKYTIDFDNANLQASFFNSIPSIEFSDDEFEFISEYEPVKVEATLEQLKTANYMIYKNENQSRLYFCFITRKEYVNPNCVKLYFKLDLLQTFMFEYTIGESFIEREHQDRFELTPVLPNSYYTPIYNRQVESLEVGSDYDYKNDYVCHNANNNTTLDNIEKNIIWYEIITTQPMTSQTYDSTNPASKKNYSWEYKEYGNYKGFYVYLVPTCPLLDTKFITGDMAGNLVELANYITGVIYESTAVYSIRKLDYCPVKYHLEMSGNNVVLYFDGNTTSGGFNKTYVIETTFNNWGGVTSDLHKYYLCLWQRDYTNDNREIGFYPVKQRYLESSTTFDINANKNINLEPKLKTYPYQYIQITDYKSEPLIIKNENLSSNNQIVIKYCQSIGSLGKAKYYVNNYNIMDNSEEEYCSINNTISELALKTDAYINYMAQNKASATTGMAINIGSGVVALGLGLATGGIGLVAGAGMALSTAQQIGNAMIKMQDLKNTPDSIRQSGNNADFEIIATRNKVIVKTLEIKPEFRNKLFNYFYRYGYKCNDFKVPNTRSRYYFNYIKTIEININTNIDSEYREQIENIYNNGLTIWHFRNASTFKGVNNYQYENCEISIVGEHPEEVING